MKKRTGCTKPLTQDELDFIKKLIDDGWSKRQIRYTYGVSNMLMLRHFPEYQGMDFKTAGSIGRAIGRTKMKKDLALSYG